MRLHLVRPVPGSAPTAIRVGLASCLALAAVAGCSTSEGPLDQSTAVQGHANHAAGATATHDHTTAAPSADASAGTAGGDAATASDERGNLEQLLGQHAVLTVRLTRARLRGDADLAQSADAALSKNTADMGASIRSVYGDEAAAEFEAMWYRHVTYLFDYARGVADGDAAVQSEARRQLDAYVAELSGFLEGATTGAAPAAVVADGLRMHVDHLVQQVDAYAGEDYARAFALERESYAHMFPLGKTLAAAILTGGGGALPADFSTPDRELRSSLGMLLGEHAELATDAMRSGVTGNPDFPAAGAALDANTRDLTAMIESVFGAEGASAFQALWADHIDAFVEYTQALAAEDEALEDAALQRLETFNTSFASFLATATEGRLAAPALAESFAAHEEFLLEQIQAYAEEDYSTAHQLSFDAYSHMFVLAADAAAAIGDTVAARSPQGGAETGAGGTAADAARG